MRKFGLIGYPLGHSFSKTYFSEKFRKEELDDCEYRNFPLEQIDHLPELLSAESELIGLNVTIPYKQEVIEFLDEIDPQAEEIGAVNTLKIYRDGAGFKLKGFNTDIYGFEEPLLNVLKPYHTRALILGTGGASKAVAYILARNGIQYTYVSRMPKNKSVLSYEQVSPEVLRRSKIVVNCSPLGMHPHTDMAPAIPYEAITSEHILYDLIYNPEKTEFLKRGEKKKATLINGLPLLYIQAERSWAIWNDSNI